MFPFKNTASVQRNITVPFPTHINSITTHQMTSSKYSFSQLNPDTLVIIDSAVENSDSLLVGIIANAVTIILNPYQDGIEKITQSLQSLKSVSSLHIISHGAPGWLQLGNSQLSLDTLERYKKQLKNWSIKHLLLYGCNVAAGDSGTEFIDKLHNLTSAEIAASANLTGSQVLGGGWDLEFKTSEFNVELAITPEAQKNYSFVLGEPVTEVTIKITSLDEQNVDLKDKDEEEIEGTFSVGNNNTLVIQSFKVDNPDSQENIDFQFNQPLENFAIQRVDNDQVEGKKQLIWFDKDDNSDTEFNAPFPVGDDGAPLLSVADPDDIMQNTLFQVSINAGID